MAFDPDVIVTSPDGLDVSLVVEAKRLAEEVPLLERDLKRYMVGRRCPVGLVFTPDKLRVYVDRYTSLQPDSVEYAGEYPITGLLPKPVRRREDDPFAFEQSIQEWLERLLDEHVRKLLPRALREVVEDIILPRLREGEIRAASPRYVP